MLKAVRFDENEHKDLLDFIANFKDSRGKLNESEAIRFLMKKGLDSLNNPAFVIQQTQPVIDVNLIKAEIYKEIIASFGSMNQGFVVYPNDPRLTNAVNPGQLQQLIEKEKDPIIKIESDNQEGKPTTTGNPLVDNMLNNRKRRGN